MCQPKAKGGKRCAAHMPGSMAVITHTAIVHNLNESVVRTVFRVLRREGKPLPAPSKEEVEDFAKEQLLRTQYDPRIEDERKRATIARRWARAAEDAPDGGTFHAWKNTMAETARRYSRKATAIGTASVIAFSAAACSGGGGALENTPPPTPSPTSSASQEYEVPDGLELSGVVDDDGNGEYARVTLSEDSPVYDYDASTVQPEVGEKFTEQDITEAQRVAADFAVEEGLDSILVDSDRTDEWYEQNADKFSPGNLESVQDALADRTQGSSLSGLVDNDVNDGRNIETNYGLVNDGGPRISKLDIKQSSVLLAPNGDLAIEFNGTASRPGITSTGEKGEEVLNFKQTYSLTKIDGEWLISGWNNSFVYEE